MLEACSWFKVEYGIVRGVFESRGMILPPALEQSGEGYGMSIFNIDNEGGTGEGRVILGRDRRRHPASFRLFMYQVSPEAG